MSLPIALLTSGSDWMLILVLAFFLFVVFGKRLPEVGRSLGKGIMEFKRGMKGLEDDVGDTYNANAGAGQQQPQPLQPEAPRPPQRITAAAPKFDEQPANPANAANPPAPPKI
jgi:sec-independent protein translocase protein TatA